MEIRKGLEVSNNRELLFDTKIVSNGVAKDNKGISISETDTARTLNFDGNSVSSGTALSKKGLSVTEVNGERILQFDGATVGGLFTQNPTTELSAQGYWQPPLQEVAFGTNASLNKDWTYAQFIAQYDLLMAQHPTYMTKKRYEVNGVPVLTSNGSYELFSYTLTPVNYTKTFFISCKVHGNEDDSSVTLLRLIRIICNETENTGYTTFKALRDNVRFVIIPIVSPYGSDVSGLNVPYPNSEYGINMNRNYDFNQQYTIPSIGVGGEEPFTMAETQHVRDLVNFIGAKNIDFYSDWHDGGAVLQHYWLSYSVDAVNRVPVMNFVNYLISKYNIQNPVIDYCKDLNITGLGEGYGGKTLGLVSSTIEWIGGYLGYDFGVAQMTQSLEVRGNMLWMAYKENWKGWKVNELPNASYFHFDYPKAFSRQTLRENTPFYTVTDSMIYSRWDSLKNANSSYITKSAILGYDATGTIPIHTYTLGNGAKKVLYVGGVMRFGATHNIDEFAMYMIAEYLCEPSIVAQSVFLQDLKNNYTIVVLPSIDNRAANETNYIKAGLNNTVLSNQRWKILNGKCVPNDGVIGQGNHGVIIIKNLIDANTTAKCIVSGGEIMGGYAPNPPDYTTNFETQIVLPKNMVSNLSTYANHLTTNRNELVSIENTQGVTFGDYAYDNHALPTYFVQLNVSKRFTELAAFHTLTANSYMHGNYEAGRRMANIVNLFLK